MVAQAQNCIVASVAHTAELRTMSQYTRRSYIALGICVIAAEFLLESSIAHHFNPNPLSPLIWSILAVVVAASLATYLRLRAKAKKGAERKPLGQ